MQNFIMFFWVRTKSPPGAPQLVTSQYKWPSNRIRTLQFVKRFAILQCKLKGSASPYIDFQPQMHILAKSSAVLQISMEDFFLPTRQSDQKVR